MSEEDNIRFVRSLWAAIDEGGLEAALELTDPEVEWRPHAAGGRVLTSEELLRFFREFQGERQLLEARPYSFQSRAISCSRRGASACGAERMSEFQIHFVYEFEEGRLVRATYARETRGARGDGPRPTPRTSRPRSDRPRADPAEAAAGPGSGRSGEGGARDPGDRGPGGPGVGYELRSRSAVWSRVAAARLEQGETGGRATGIPLPEGESTQRRTRNCLSAAGPRASRSISNQTRANRHRWLDPPAVASVSTSNSP